MPSFLGSLVLGLYPGHLNLGWGSASLPSVRTANCATIGTVLFHARLWRIPKFSNFTPLTNFAHFACSSPPTAILSPLVQRLGLLYHLKSHIHVDAPHNPTLHEISDYYKRQLHAASPPVTRDEPIRFSRSSSNRLAAPPSPVRSIVDAQAKASSVPSPVTVAQTPSPLPVDQLKLLSFGTSSLNVSAPPAIALSTSARDQSKNSLTCVSPDAPSVRLNASRGSHSLGPHDSPPSKVTVEVPLHDPDEPSRHCKPRMKRVCYDVDTQIGMQGASAIVYRATNTLDESEVVAVKVYHQKLTSGCATVKSEIRVLRQLVKTHQTRRSEKGSPYLVHHMGYQALPDQRCYVVLPWCIKTLADIMEEFEMLYDEERLVMVTTSRYDMKVLAYAAELSSAIGFLHACHYAHRDIKPQNVLISQQGHIRLADFGAADRTMADGTPRFDYQPIVGTPYYFSPELEKYDDSAGISLNIMKTDIWAFGMIVTQLLLGTVTRGLGWRQILEEAHERQDQVLALLPDAYKLLAQVLDDDPALRPSIAQIQEHDFFDIMDFGYLEIAADMPFDDVVDYLEGQMMKGENYVDSLYNIARP